MRVCELTIYTTNAALTFDIVASAADFQERLANALEEGTVILDTVDGSRLVLNAINVVAIEIHEAKSVEISEDTPPAKNI